MEVPKTLDGDSGASRWKAFNYRSVHFKTTYAKTVYWGAFYQEQGWKPLLYVVINQQSFFTLENAAARFLLCVHKCEHITLGLMSLHWLPVCYRINFKILLYVLKSLNRLAPTYILNLLFIHNSLRSFRSSDQRMLTIPKTRLKLRGDQTFSIVARKLWNSHSLYVKTNIFWF